MRMPGLRHRAGQVFALLGFAIALLAGVVVSLANLLADLLSALLDRIPPPMERNELEQHLRHRRGQVFALLGLAIVLPAWVVVSLADRVHRQLPRLRLPHPRLPRPRRPRDAWVVGLVVLAIASWSLSIAMMGLQPPTLSLAVFVLVGFGSALLAFARHSPDALVVGLVVLAIAGWSLSVALIGIGLPTLVFLLVFVPTALVAFALRRLDPVPEYLAGLVEDWLSRDGWKGQVLGIGPPPPNEDNPFRFAEGVRAYRVVLEDEWGQARFGWFRLGNGRIDFDWDENPSGEPIGVRPVRSREPAIAQAPSSPETLTGHDPLWDRWLDG